MTRRICVVTGTRAEYGLLHPLIRRIRADSSLTGQLLVTGAHLSPRYGMTFREIEADGLAIDQKVDIDLDDNSDGGIARSVARGMSGITDALLHLRPDVVVLLGDRFEILAAACAALFLRIPIAHIHGGEVTEGAIDESIRHAVTKMASLHFVAAQEYRARVIQLGEDPSRVFLTGGLGVDAILETRLLDRAAVERAMDFRLGDKSLLITFHPATRDLADSRDQVAELLTALSSRTDTQLVFTMPNADSGSQHIAGMIETFVSQNPNAKAFASLGSRLYLSCMAQVSGVVGNSSSGLLEAPTLGIGTVNIGDRQRGRLKAESVIDCAAERKEITAALDRLFSAEFQQRLAQGVESPYGKGGAAAKILAVLRDHPLTQILKKPFHDIPLMPSPR